MTSRVCLQFTDSRTLVALLSIPQGTLQHDLPERQPEELSLSFFKAVDSRYHIEGNDIRSSARKPFKLASGHQTHA